MLPNESSNGGEVLLCISVTGSKGPAYAEFDPDVFNERGSAEVPIGNEMFLVFVVETRTHN